MLTRLLRGLRRPPALVTGPLLEAGFRRTLCEYFCAQDGPAIARALAGHLPRGAAVTVAFDPVAVPHPMSCAWSLAKQLGSDFIFPAFQPGQLVEVVVERWLSLFDLFFAAQRECERDGWTMISFNDLGPSPAWRFAEMLPVISSCPISRFSNRAVTARRGSINRNQPRWEERSPRVFWRGSSVGQKNHAILEMPRARLCLLAQEMGAHWGDIGLAALFHISEADADELRHRQLVEAKCRGKS